MNAIKNITIGHTKRLCRPVGLTCLLYTSDAADEL